MTNEKKKTNRFDRSHCYKASERETLTAGVKFRAAGGPYYESRNSDAAWSFPEPSPSSVGLVGATADPSITTSGETSDGN
jgi:hypothetical protein